MRFIDAYKLLGVIAEQERWNVPDFVYKSIKEAPAIDIDSIIAEHENIGYEKGFRDGYAEAVDAGKWTERKVITDNDAIEEWQSAKCSKCGKYHTTPYMYYFNHYDYCPHCGARMVNDDSK